MEYPSPGRWNLRLLRVELFYQVQEKLEKKEFFSFGFLFNNEGTARQVSCLIKKVLIVVKTSTYMHREQSN